MIEHEGRKDTQRRDAPQSSCSISLQEPHQATQRVGLLVYLLDGDGRMALLTQVSVSP